MLVQVDGADAGVVPAGQQRRFELEPGARTVQLSDGAPQVLEVRREVDIVVGPVGEPCFVVFATRRYEPPRVQSQSDAGVPIDLARGADVAWPARERMPDAERVVVPVPCADLALPDSELLERLPPPRKSP